MTRDTGKKRRRGKRNRRRNRLLKIIVVAMLVLALCGLGVWMLLELRPRITVRDYPVAYEDLIRAQAAENDIPPAYVAAVILAESSYRPEAVSSVNAQGLMQLLPSTAEWIAGKYGEAYVEGTLFDPELNIRYGCWYLGFLMKRYDGDMTCATAAYHAGQGTVDKWLQNPEYSADGKTLNQIKSDATGTYVKRVLKYYEKYDEIYDRLP